MVHDPRLELSLFAADPDIVTPIGMAIDRSDRIFVIESLAPYRAAGRLWIQIPLWRRR